MSPTGLCAASAVAENELRACIIHSMKSSLVLAAGLLSEPAHAPLEQDPAPTCQAFWPHNLGTKGEAPPPGVSRGLLRQVHNSPMFPDGDLCQQRPGLCVPMQSLWRPRLRLLLAG